MVYVVDFGSQTAHLISRRLKELGAETKIVHPERILKHLPVKHALALQAGVQNDKGIKGIILSGGPASVYEKKAPSIDSSIFSLGIPVLGICYGLQLMARLLGGKVVSGKKEYGPAVINLPITNHQSLITKSLPKSFIVWMSHGDEVVQLPKGFEVLGSTEHVKFAFVQNLDKKLFGVQFHPEVEHTENGTQILRNFLNLSSGGTPRRSPFGHLRGARSGHLGGGKVKIINYIKQTVGDSYVIGAVSGGVDSTVAGILTAEAIGERFMPIYVENGLMREGTKEHVHKIFQNHSSSPIVVEVMGEMLKRLKGITDPEQKRKIIGNFYIEVFEQEMEKILKSGKNVRFLLQGTIYSDVIESKGTKHASKIKSHHNVGGLPEKMKLKLLEPLRNFYKDEVREIGKSLGLSEEFVYKQPFPGPGYAIRIRGEVTKERLQKENQADKIILEEIEKAGLLKDVFLSFPVMTGAYSTAVKGDGRFFGEVVALRVVQSKDVMTSTWARLPYDLLQKISSRIVNEIEGISRVVYDISTKPPATMEWE